MFSVSANVTQTWTQCPMTWSYSASIPGLGVHMYSEFMKPIIRNPVDQSTEQPKKSLSTFRSQSSTACLNLRIEILEFPDKPFISSNDATGTIHTPLLLYIPRPAARAPKPLTTIYHDNPLACNVVIWFSIPQKPYSKSKSLRPLLITPCLLMSL